MKRDIINTAFALIITFAMLVSGCGALGGFGDDLRPTEGPQVTSEGVRFSIYSTRIERVSIAGEFNNWSMTADPMVDKEGTGVWTILLPLPPGRYEYKFVINGEKWIADPGNQETVDDGFGGVNSVVVVE